MKKMMFFLPLLILLIAGVALYFYSHRHSLAQARVKSALEALTGLKTEVKNVSVDRAGKIISIESVILENPSGFDSKTLAEISNVKIVLNHPFALQGVDIKRLSADLDKINIEKKTKFNIEQIKALSPSGVDHKPAAASFHIERLEYRFKRLRYLEVTAGTETHPTDVDLNGRVEVYENIRNPAFLIQAPALKVIETFNKGSLGLPRGKIAKVIHDQSR